MITIETVYSGELRTLATHLKSGKQIITDAPPDNKGKGEAFSPTDLMCASLGSCMLTIIGISGDANNYSIEGTKISITKIMDSNPRRVSEIQIEFMMPLILYSEKIKQMIITAAMNCPVAKSIHPAIILKVEFHFNDEIRVVQNSNT